MKEISAILFSCNATYSKLAALSPQGESIILFSGLYSDINEKPLPFFNLPFDIYHENIQDGICILHNPFAEHPLPDNLFRNPGITHYKFFPKRNIFVREKSKPFLVMRSANFLTISRNFD